MTADRVEAVLADFRDWLARLPATTEDFAEAEETGPDLFTLLAELTALRQEVNLQTKATRAQQEQSVATLAQLTRALDSLQQSREAASRERDESVRRLLKTLIELYDALAVASREARRVQETILPFLADSTTEPTSSLPELPPVPRLPGWARWLGLRDAEFARYAADLTAWQEQEQERADRREKGLERVRQLLVSLTSGYSMSLQRLERALKQYGLEPIATVGQPFDPERMEAVEAVTDSGRPGGQVLDEVQRGYCRGGRVFRFARVRVAKS